MKTIKLVEIKKSELFATSEAIAINIEKTHDTIIKLIDRNIDDLKEFGEVGFEIRAGYNNSQVRIALLNEHQATLLITYMRNTAIVRAFKKRLIKEFFKMREELLSKNNIRQLAKCEYRPMTDAILKNKSDLGKEIKSHHFSNEADLINRIVLGMTSAKFRVHHDIDKKESIRDYLSSEQIRCVTELQRANTSFILMGWDFQKRKDLLFDLFNKHFKQPLLLKQHQLAS